MTQPDDWRGELMTLFSRTSSRRACGTRELKSAQQSHSLLTNRGYESRHICLVWSSEMDATLRIGFRQRCCLLLGGLLLLGAVAPLSASYESMIRWVCKPICSITTILVVDTKDQLGVNKPAVFSRSNIKSPSNC